MFETINEIAVLVSAFLALAIGSVWYSPLVLGKEWQRAAGLGEGELSLSRSEFIRSLVIAFLGNLSMLFCLAHALRVGEIVGEGKIQVIIALFTFLIAAIVSAVAWERKSVSYILIHAGYVLLVISMGVTVIGLWPW